MVTVNDWNNLVEEVYGRPYNFQQQYGCQPRQMFHLYVPCAYADDDEMYDEIPEEVNGEVMGVKFEKWLERDPKQPLKGINDDYLLTLFWYRNFYPDIYTVANDLYKKGLIERGDYIIKY